MRDVGEEFRRRARSQGLGTVGARYPEDLRGLALACWRQASEEGRSRREVAASLRIGAGTLARWIAVASESPAVESMPEVRVSGSLAAAGVGVVITPRGYRVEGLTVPDLALLLPVLG
jgi:hypothetical protein